ncbi:MAG: hypothetical protein [Microviridae sp.]|nr:MAG: hypothetical protein [Microviridae sp.]
MKDGNWKFKRNSNRVVSYDYSLSDIRTEEGLSMTPQQMLECQQKGLAVASFNSEFLNQGSENVRFDDLLAEDTRGVDPAELWEIQQFARRKLITEHRKDKKRFD